MGTSKAGSFTVEAVVRYRKVEFVISRETLDNMAECCCEMYFLVTLSAKKFEIGARLRTI
jgi:hypothetical protein